MKQHCVHAGPPLLLVVAALFVTGCGKPTPETALPEDPGSAAAMSEPGGKIENPLIGVEECDSFILKYQRCIDRVPESDQRQAMTKGLEQTRRTWKSAATDIDQRETLVSSCLKMADTLESAMRSQGCEWD